jgi:hypothetical protein
MGASVERVLELFQHLETQGDAAVSLDEADLDLDGLKDLLDTAEAAKAKVWEDVWQAVSTERVLLPEVARAFDNGMNSKGNAVRIICARTYAALLCTPACPFFSFFSPMTFDSLLRKVKEACVDGKKKAQGGEYRFSFNILFLKIWIVFCNSRT